VTATEKIKKKKTNTGIINGLKARIVFHRAWKNWLYWDQKIPLV